MGPLANTQASSFARQRERKRKDMTYDVIVIGAGVTGSAVARELSRYDVKTVVLEKEGGRL
jgi:choline dehydrogenase-like flavoprotein